METKEIINFFISLTPSLIIAGFTAYITVHLSIKKFRTERWWEEKVKVYLSLFESLSNIQKYNQEVLNADESGANLSKDYRNELKKKAGSGIAEIKRIEAIGSFVISPKNVERLTQFIKKYEDVWFEEKSHYDILDIRLHEIRTCIEDICADAKKDLNIID